MGHPSSSLRLVILLLAGLAGQSAWAVVPSQQLLPQTAKGYISIPDIYRLQADFEKTQIGQLLADPVMKPFADDLRRQLKDKWTEAHEPLGLGWDDIQNVPGGEVAMARIQPGKDKTAVAMIVDVNGKQAEVDELLSKVAKKMTSRNAAIQRLDVDGVELTVYTETREANKGRQAIFFVHPTHHQLVASDNLEVAKGILGRFAGNAKDNLATVKAYQVATQRVEKEQGESVPHVRWFAEPFGFVEATRAANPNYRPKKGKDVITILRNQGFAAVKGIGGLVTFADESHDILHRTMVYAPGVERATGDPNQEKYDFAMRMLDFPNKDAQVHEPPAWIPRNLAAFASVSADMINGFEYSKSLVNELADDDIFDDVINSLRDDPAGPQIDVRKEVVANLGERVMVMSDYDLPIRSDSERMLVAFELTNVEPVRRAVDKTMENDPNAVKRMIGKHIAWEIVEDEVEKLDVDIDFGDFDAFEEEEEEDKQKSLPTSAVTVAHGHLIISSHIDFIEKALDEAERRQTLSGSVDYQTIKKTLTALGATAGCVQTFSRTDEEFRGTYEMLKQGKMPESQSLMGQILNLILDENAEDEKLRQQQLDGSKLPEYQMVRRYLGPAGIFVVSHDDGWLATGCFLSKETLQVVLKAD